MSSSVVLVEGKRARCAVELAADPSAAEQMAGEELAQYLERLGGASIDLCRGGKSEAPVRILVGARAREEVNDLPVGELKDDGFVLHVAPDRIALVGRTTRERFTGRMS